MILALGVPAGIIFGHVVTEDHRSQFNVSLLNHISKLFKNSINKFSRVYSKKIERLEILVSLYHP